MSVCPSFMEQVCDGVQAASVQAWTCNLRLFFNGALAVETKPVMWMKSYNLIQPVGENDTVSYNVVVVAFTVPFLQS